MPITSFLVHPQDEKKEKLFSILSKMPYCEVIPSENKNLLVLVTETSNEEEEKQLIKEIEAIDCVSLLSVVAGFKSPKNN